MFVRALIFITIAVFAGGCIQNATLTISSTESTTTTTSTPITVAPRFSAAPNWNDYVRAASTTTACDGTETSSTACIHGGERKSVVTSQTSCSGLSMTDSLGAFMWNCTVVNGYATFYSFLKWDKGLRDLVDTSGWKPNSVTLSGAASASTAPATWWTNPVTIVSSAISPATTYATAGGIYVITNTISNEGINLNADKIGLVTLSTAVISWPNILTTNFNVSNGEAAAPDSRAHISAGSQKFLWIEVGALSTSANKAMYGVALISCSFSRIHQSGILGHTTAGIYLENSPYNLFTGNTLTQNARGFYISNSNSNRFTQNKTADSSTFGGVYLWASHGNTFVETLSASNADTGFEFSSSNNNNIVAATIPNNLNNAVYLSSAQATSIHLEAAVNNNFTLSHTAANNSTFSQIAGTDHDIYGTTYSQSSGVKYTGNLLAHNPVSCTGGAGYGITSACTPEGASNQNLVTINSISADLFGIVSTDDTSNASDSFGTASYSLGAMDWFQFQNSMRAWGKSFTFPGTSSKGVCSVGTCRMYDYSVLAAGSIIFNRTGNGATPNSAASPGAWNGQPAMTPGEGAAIEDRNGGSEETQGSGCKERL